MGKIRARRNDRFVLVLITIVSIKSLIENTRTEDKYMCEALIDLEIDFSFDV